MIPVDACCRKIPDPLKMISGTKRIAFVLKNRITITPWRDGCQHMCRVIKWK